MKIDKHPTTKQILKVLTYLCSNWQRYTTLLYCYEMYVNLNNREKEKANEKRNIKV